MVGKHRVEMLIVILTDSCSEISDESVFIVHFKWSEYRKVVA